MKILALILARKNSIRLKNKNLKKINSKTIVERSIEIANILKKKKRFVIFLFLQIQKKY